MDCYATAGLRARPSLRPVSPLTHVVVAAVSLLGGVLGILGAVVVEVRTGGLILLPVIGAPVIEEALKPIGVYLALVRWPRALQGRLYRAVLCAGAGVVFGLIESWVYVNVYATDEGDAYRLFRYTVPVALHAVASFTVGLGIDRRVVEWVNRGGRFPRRTLRFYIAGAVIHGVYNLAALVLYLAGVDLY